MADKSQETELLTKLLNFYKKKYKGNELDEKFYNAVMDLISTGDVNKATYFAFCVDNDMEPHLKSSSSTSKKPKLKTSGSSSSSSTNNDGAWGFGGSQNYDPCSGGGSYRTSSC